MHVSLGHRVKALLLVFDESRTVRSGRHYGYRPGIAAAVGSLRALQSGRARNPDAPRTERASGIIEAVPTDVREMLQRGPAGVG